MVLSFFITVLGGLSKRAGVCIVMDRKKEGTTGWDEHAHEHEHEHEQPVT